MTDSLDPPSGGPLDRPSDRPWDRLSDRPPSAGAGSDTTGAGTTSGQPTGELTVMTFNIRTAAAPDLLHPWVRRRRAVADVVDACTPDVVALQEPTGAQLRWLTGEWPALEVHSEGRRGEGKGERGALAVRSGAVVVDEIEPRWFSDTPMVAGSRSWGNRLPRFALVAHCRCPDGRLGVEPFLVVGLHLDHLSGRSRRRSTEALVAWLADSGVRSWIIMGDFNTTPDDAALTPLWEAGLIDVLADLPASGSGAGTMHGFRGHDRGRRIDHVVVSADWVVQSARVVRERSGGRLASDHWPVMARLRRDPTP
ncbi:MAG: endonuclease/exonuclease/phosphatase family protein [Acidimicrobiia bacterium]|nr:endonuclease/exonuclease/phosphatase family protein [Acidimicrobiia bacterium]